MTRIGLRELRQNASEYLRRVEEGESFEVTNRGRVVAELVPPSLSALERLEREGRITKAKGSHRDWPPPLPAAPPGVPTLSEILAEMRDEER